jgi:hypothetical protein
MPRRDWIHKYPGVATLLQTDADVLLTSAVEDPAAQVNALLGLRPFVEPVEAWCAIARTQLQRLVSYDGIRRRFLFVDRDRYGALCATAAQGRTAVLPVSYARAHGGALSIIRLYGHTEIRPHDGLPPHTWFPHWSVEDEPHLQVVGAERSRWTHPMSWAVDAGGLRVGFADRRPSLCATARPAFVCRCAGTLLRWE